MDPLTHILSASLWSEPITAPSLEKHFYYARWRDRAVVILGALAPDVDGLLGAVSLKLYSQYHRVVTHSFLGLLVIMPIIAAIAFYWPEGWMLPSLRSKPGGKTIVKPSFVRLMLLAALALAWHFVGDWITAWGIWPFWPFSMHDCGLALVNSLEPGLLLITLLFWLLQQQRLHHKKRRQAWALAGLWLLACVIFIWLRPLFLPPPFI